MLTQSPPKAHLVSLTNIVEKQSHLFQQENSVLFQAVLENLPDGILILTKAGEIVYSNYCARQICTQLNSGGSPLNNIPKPIEQICKTLMGNYNNPSHVSTVIETEIKDGNKRTLRVRAYWLEGHETELYLLITLEDHKRSLHDKAIMETIKYELTPREAEIWLLRRVGSTYKEIAAQLYISLNTVKKHLKNINIKQKPLLT